MKILPKGLPCIGNDSNDTCITDRYLGCNCKELSTDMEGIKLDMTIVESKQGKAISDNSRAIDQVMIRADVHKMQSEFERINHTVSSLTNKLVSDVNNADVYRG